MTREERLQQFAEQAIKGLYLDRHNLIQMVKQGAEWADSHPQWIPVEERLPHENEEVLAYNAENEEVIACDYHHRMFHCWPEAFNESITHWMPMPMPPQGKEGNK